MTFTIEEIREYVQSQDSLGDVLYNLSEENITRANTPVDKNSDAYREGFDEYKPGRFFNPYDKRFEQEYKDYKAGWDAAEEEAENQ